MKCERCNILKYSIYLAERKVGVERLKIGDVCPKCWAIQLNNKWEEFSKKKVKQHEIKKPKFYGRTKCKKCGSVRLKFIKKPIEHRLEGTRWREYNKNSWYYSCKKCGYNSQKMQSLSVPR